MSPRVDRPNAEVSGDEEGEPARTVGLHDEFWVEPLQVGQRKQLMFTINGIRVNATMEADFVRAGEVGWARIVGFAIGVHALQDADDLEAEDGGNEAIINHYLATRGVLLCSPEPDVLDIMRTAATQAARALDAFEQTRRIRVALHGHESKRPRARGQRGPELAPDPSRNRDSERREAANIYNLLVALEKSNPGPWIDEWMGIRPSKRKELLAEAEERGLLKQRLKGGRNSTAKKTTVKKATTKKTTAKKTTAKKTTARKTTPKDAKQ